MKVLLVSVCAALLCASSGVGAFPADGLFSPHLTGASPVENLAAFPYAVALKLTTDSGLVRLCAAVRIPGNWFVTAAECLERLTYKSARMVMTYPSGDQYSQLTFDLSNARFVNHPAYNQRTKENNIGIFTVDGARLPALSEVPQLPVTDDASFGDKVANVVAWKVNPNSQSSPSMMVAETSVLTAAACKKEYYFTTLAKDSICASGAGKKSFSKHDAGVPLVVKSDGKVTLVGIGSTKLYPRTSPSNPMVFTSLNPFTKWIQEEIQKAH